MCLLALVVALSGGVERTLWTESVHSGPSPGNERNVHHDPCAFPLLRLLACPFSTLFSEATTVPRQAQPQGPCNWDWDRRPSNCLIVSLLVKPDCIVLHA